MFNHILKRQKPRVFLGVVAVVPRTDLKRLFEDWDPLNFGEVDDNLRQRLTEIFCLPLARDVIEPQSSDLVLDVVIPKYQYGQLMEFTAGEVFMPFLWRPKITVSSRLYYLTTEKTKATLTMTAKMQWGHYVSRIVSWRYFLGFRPTFDLQDMEALLYQACYKLLLKLQTSI